MDEAMKRKLLADVKRTSEELEHSKIARVEALRSAMDAGIARQEIAEAAGLTRQAVHYLVTRKA